MFPEAATYGPDVAADHQAHVLGERMNQLKQSRTRVWITSQHQTLRPVNKEVNHSDTFLNIRFNELKVLAKSGNSCKKRIIQNLIY